VRATADGGAATDSEERCFERRPATYNASAANAALTIAPGIRSCSS